MYLSNEDRIRLGLQHYGSDVPDDVVAAAEAALAGAADLAATTEAPAPKKRARTKKGEPQADDLMTSDQNEAWEQAAA